MLPKNLKYGSKVESAVSRSYRTNIQPQNGTGPYNVTGETITVNIPTRNNLVLVPSESFLKFKLNINSGAAGNSFRFDSCGAHAVIQRIRVWHGSNLLSDIDSYSMLAKILFDTQVSTDACYGKYNVASGTRSDTVVACPAAGFVATNAYSAIQANSGELIGGNAAVANGGVVSDTYCIPLISIVGSLCSAQYLPLFAMTSAPLRVEIQLVSSVIAMCAAAGAATATLTNVEYVGQFIELGDSAMSSIYSSLNGEPLQLVVPDWRNYQFTGALANGAATQLSMPIPAKFSSLKALLCSVREKGTGAATYFPCSSNTQGITSYQFRLGSQVLPSKPPDTLQEMFMEVQKAVASISDLAYQPSIDKASYTQVVAAINVDSATNVSYTNSGSFCVGLDLENYSGASKDTIFSGYNSNTDDIFFIPNFTATQAVAACRFDAFANFDAVLVCENNTMYVKF